MSFAHILSVYPVVAATLKCCSANSVALSGSVKKHSWVFTVTHSFTGYCMVNLTPGLSPQQLSCFS